MVCFQSGLGGNQNPSKCNHVMLSCPWKTPASTSLADKWQYALEYLETTNAARPCTVCFTQWVCCFTYKLQTCSLLNLIWPLPENMLNSFKIFSSWTWLSAEVLHCEPWQHLPVRAQARGRTSPNARGCFKLACAPRVNRRRKSGDLCACSSKKEVIILQNWHAAEPLMRCIPKWNCWKWTLHNEEAKKKKKSGQRYKIRPPVYGSYLREDKNSIY